MKKVLAKVLLGLLISSNAWATNGYAYLGNVNDVFGSPNKIQFKLVAKKDDGTVAKSIETPELGPKQVVSYKLTDFGLNSGRLDLYARDLTKSTAYDSCENDYPYSTGDTVIARGWSESRNATCRFSEEVSGK